nr:molybdopterin-dependent oxidoreductase [Ardenticatenales bacterium]
MQVTLTINGESQTLDSTPAEPLLALLRRNGYFGVKHGCETGECGACAVLLNGQPVVSCVMLAGQAAGAQVTTIEAMGTRKALHPLQRAFAANGSIQCGYCTPAMILAAAALLEERPNPSEAEVREALSGVLCRCTGYLKPVEAVLHAAAEVRGDAPEWPEVTPEGPTFKPTLPDTETEVMGRGQPVPPPYHDDSGSVITTTRTVIRPMTVRPPSDQWGVVGKPEVKVDAVKLALGKPAFTDDIEMRGMLHAKVLHSPVAHAWIRRIDASRARALPGVHAVLTHEDLPRVVYSTAGQSDPIPGPLDTFSLDRKVRFVGDRVALVAAESPEIAERALELIEVDYEPLPLILDPREAMREGAVVLHDEPEFVPFADSEPDHNLAAKIRIEMGDVEAGFAEAEHIFEEEYVVPKVQQASIEPHVVVTWWDENDRLVIRTSTQVPFHVRRMMAPVLGLPPKQIRVIKPRIGGGFGGKQEVMIEDVAALLTIATG